MKIRIVIEKTVTDEAAAQSVVNWVDSKIGSEPDTSIQYKLKDEKDLLPGE